MATFRGVAPILPVRDVAAALAHYTSLGFAVRRYEDGQEYGYAERDGVQLHLGSWAEHDPARTGMSIYLYVDDADALYSEWLDANAGGRLHPPQDTPWGMREAVHVDPEGNTIRFGHSLGGR
jgi:predicted enzyme related to lactoylglutathione lyase